MTRAALLNLLASPESLSAAAVQDLEQLAQAFPYCQTAHVLLAKAAHEQGSMLAGQRLRRAATYATDRQLLRQLLERPAQLPTPPSPPNSAPLAPAPEAVAPNATPETPAVVSVVAPEILFAPALAASAIAAETPAAAEEDPILLIEAASAALVEAAGTAVAASAVSAPTAEPLPEDVAEPATPASLSDEAVLELSTVPVVATEDELPELAPTRAEAPAEPAKGPLLPALVAAAAITQEVEIEEDVVEDELVEPAVAIAADSDYPSADAAAEPDPAPVPIQPPAEAGAARFELGLSPTALESGFSTYQLAEAASEEPLAPAPASRSALAQPAVAAFAGDADLAYALSGGSRLGYAMQPAFGFPVDSLPPPELPAAEMPGSPLPPAGEFFAPDALLLEHLASLPPPALAAPSPLDLIDSFLRRAPQRRRGIVTLLTVPEQADLSLRSTRAEPDLASESLARILAGQGKTERAIAVYERLMVRQPEKSAYFAVQIDLLRNPRTPS